MNKRAVILISIVTIFAVMLFSAAQLPASAAQLRLLGITGTPLFLPLIAKGYACPTTSTNSYDAGIAYQAETDDPIRPAVQHADKNLELRGYTLNTSSVSKFPKNYGQDDPSGPPQLKGLFIPNRAQPFPFANVYYSYNWDWAPSPAPGTRGTPITDWEGVQLAGLATTPGETIYVPDAPGYNIGGSPTQYEVLVLYAAAERITFVFFRQDIINAGYAIHIENICVDPNLLALYNSLDTGARYVVGSGSYDLPNLPVGKPLGTAKGNEIIVAIRDSGAFMDPRSCEWWWDANAGGVNCGHHSPLRRFWRHGSIGAGG